MCYTNPSRAGAAGTERYRSGHNGADSKSVCAKAHKGSNPFLSANAGHRKVSFFALAFERIRTGAFSGNI